MLVIAAGCLADAVRTLMPRALSAIQSSKVRLAVGGIAACAILFAFEYQVRSSRWNYVSLVPLDLPGASHIRLTSGEVWLYQELVRPLARPETETFLTLPGLNSLYFWAQKDPPTGFNVTTWMTLLDDRCQERVVEAASKYRGLMVVRNRILADWWVEGRPIRQLPLVRYIDEQFYTVKSIDGYELMMRR